MVDSALLIDPGAIARGAEDSFRPSLFHSNVPLEFEALRSLVASGTVLFVHDTLMEQLGELVETRAPDRRLTRDEVTACARDHCGDEPFVYGTWVYYPWSARLVHVLPENEYEELRTNRNRNKITREEQSLLAKLRIGIAGLSVGQSTAVTMALEGVGGLFRLADFDTLSLSNMNRLRAGVHDIGVNKAVLAAREIFQINPYAHVEVFERGIRDETFTAFFSDTATLDLLFDECDDLKMKFRLREEARRRGIPVLMETSDRGLIDIERFDREPRRPLFHSLVREVDPERLAGMTTHEKIPVILEILGTKTLSRRMTASLIDIDATLKTWPQLASAVALGGAINTDVARRIALGRLHGSGRFFVDIEGIVSDEAATPPLVAESFDAAAQAGTQARVLRQVAAGEPISTATLERLVHQAALAPSGGNCQPWRFRYKRGRLQCWHDEARSRSLLDYDHRATYAAFGALGENIRLAAGTLGIGVQLLAFPEPSDPTLICEAQFGGQPEPQLPEDVALAGQIELRVTNRRIDKRVPIATDDARALEDVAASAGAHLQLVTDTARLDSLGEVLGMGERLRLMSKTMHREMMSEIRWSHEEAVARRDGLDLPTLELTPTDLAALQLISEWRVMATVREVGGGQGLTTPSRKAIAAASAVGLLTVDGSTSDSSAQGHTYFRGGIALQRVWLMATKLGFAFQPMTSLVYLFARLEQGEGVGLDEHEKRELAEIRLRYCETFRTNSRATEVMLFRLANAGPPSARSLRRTVDEMLLIEE